MVFFVAKVVTKHIFVLLTTSVFLNPMGVIDLWAAQEAGYAAEVAQAISKCSPTGPEKRDTLRPLTPILVLDSIPYMHIIYTHTYISPSNSTDLKINS